MAIKVPNLNNSKLSYGNFPLFNAVGGLSAYKIGSYRPQTILDFQSDKYYAANSSSSTTAASLLTHTRSGNAVQVADDGTLQWAGHNLSYPSEGYTGGNYSNTCTVTTGQTPPEGLSDAAKLDFALFNRFSTSVTITPGAKYTIACWLRADSAGTMSFYNASSGTPYSSNVAITTEWQRYEIQGPTEPSSGTNSLGLLRLSGDLETVYVAGFQIYRSDLGGMADIPTSYRGLSSSSTYLPTTTAARYLPRVDNHIWDGSSWVKRCLVEPQSTNLVLNSNSLETQTVAVTPNEPHTLSFYPGASTVDLDDTIASTAVDVFVYDTSKDSDGGAWAVSYPTMMVIVAEGTSVKIYDATDNTLPLHTTLDFTGYTVTSLSAVSGILAVGTTTGLATFNLADGDTTVALDYTTSTTPAIVNNAVNDCAMTVLSGAPTDPATGLPVPTIAVATDGNGTYSTSIITDSGDIYDIASDSTGTAVSVAFDGMSVIVTRSDGTVYVWDDAGTIAADGASPDTTYSASSTPALLGTVSKVAA